MGTVRNALFPQGSFLDFGDHAVAGPFKELGLSPKPIMTRYYLERSGILPEGKVIEEDVRNLSGYRGTDYEGEHTVTYRP